MKNKFIYKGQSLFELLGAVAVIGIVLIALVSLSTKSIQNSTISKNSTQATRFSQEALEWMRTERDTDWNTFSARGTAGGKTYCLDTLSWNNSGKCNQIEFISGTVFRREAVILFDQTSNPNSVEVDITTSWSEGDNSRASKSTTVLTNWKNK